VTVRWYGLKGTFGMANLPDASVVVVRSKALTGLRIVTVAFGTTAPDGSTTTPTTELELPDCAYPETFKIQNKTTTEVARSNSFGETSINPSRGKIG